VHEDLVLTVEAEPLESRVVLRGRTVGALDPLFPQKVAERHGLGFTWDRRHTNGLIHCPRVTRCPKARYLFGPLPTTRLILAPFASFVPALGNCLMILPFFRIGEVFLVTFPTLQ
jgi:hypothetical protein